jgi:homogentisate 1,2-dioxygenase
MFGDLGYGPLDVVIVPRGTTWRLRPDPTPHLLVVLETSSPVGPPARYRNGAGQFLHRSLYSERDLRTPVLGDARSDAGEFDVVVKTGEQLARHVVPGHPFDVVGWDGALYPYALNLGDVEPLSGRVHLMPDMHQVFACSGAVICAITPARLADHPGSYPAQPDHVADCDELYYRFASEGGPVPGLGAITLHTRAAAHGPRPGFEDAPRRERASLWGLIIDVAKPVRMTAAAAGADDASYTRSWL